MVCWRSFDALFEGVVQVRFGMTNVDRNVSDWRAVSPEYVSVPAQLVPRKL